MRPQRPCIEPDCGALHRNPGPRCGPHTRTFNKARNQARTQYHGTWQATSRAARKAQPWCTRCGTGQDLTLDHETGTVECRSCNSSHRRNAGGGA